VCRSTLNGGAGNDRMIGGTGNDKYVVDSTGDVVVENPGAGTDTVSTTLNSYTLEANVENLTFTGAGNFSGTGNFLDNAITGGAGDDTLSGGNGNDRLDGGLGSDTLIGGAGDDTYITDGADTLTEGVNAGVDTVQSSVTFTLATNFENLALTGVGNIDGTGNAAANQITGNAGNNNLSGLEGTM
jgi:Ca2+-binding RTX toxin-like protein